MRRLGYVWIMFVAVMVSIPVYPGFVHQSHAQVFTTYQGDTAESIKRRQYWIGHARKEGELFWWGVLAPDQGKKIIDEFNKIYPFIKVNYWRGKGEEIAAKFQSEIVSGRFSVDVCLGGEEINLPLWRERGVLAKFVDIIPGVHGMDKRNFSKQGDWVRLGSNAFIAAYNSKLVSPSEAPKNYEDLLDPKWKGKIGMTSDVKQWWTYALGDGGWGMEKTERFLTKLREQDLIYGGDPTVLLTMLIAGEYKIAAQGYLYRYLGAKDKGAPVDWIRVNPVVVGGAGFIMNAKAPHPNAARLFLEWLLSPRGLTIHDEITAGGSALPGMGTRQSKAIEGLNICIKDEEVVLKAYELGLEEKYAKILGVFR